MSTEQKVAVITGASQGIGASLVEAYRGRGSPSSRRSTRAAPCRRRQHGLRDALKLPFAPKVGLELREHPEHLEEGRTSSHRKRGANREGESTEAPGRGGLGRPINWPSP
jgi:hypothetical protein